MVIGLFSGIVETVLKPFDWFFSVIPRPVKWSLFILFIVLFGAFVTNTIIGNRYACNSDCELVDNRDFSNCIITYQAGWFYKMNLSQSECEAYAEAIGDPDFNETICQELIKDVKTVNTAEYIISGLRNLPRRFLEWFIDFPFTQDNKTYFYDYLFDQGGVLCADLYDCLSPESRAELELTPDCTIYKGMNNTADNFPTPQEYADATQKLIISEDANIDEFKLLSVNCYDFGVETGCAPEFGFFGIPILRYELWITFIVIGAFLWLIFKL